MRDASRLNRKKLAEHCVLNNLAVWTVNSGHTNSRWHLARLGRNRLVFTHRVKHPWVVAAPRATLVRSSPPAPRTPAARQRLPVSGDLVVSCHIATTPRPARPTRPAPCLISVAARRHGAFDDALASGSARSPKRKSQSSPANRAPRSRFSHGTTSPPNRAARSTACSGVRFRTRNCLTPRSQRCRTTCSLVAPAPTISAR